MFCFLSGEQRAGKKRNGGALKNFVSSAVEFVMFLCSGVDTHLSDSCSKRPRSGMGNFEEVVRWIEDHGRLPRRNRDPEHKTEDMLAQRWKKWVDNPKMLAEQDQKKLEELKASFESSVGRFMELLNWIKANGGRLPRRSRDPKRKSEDIMAQRLQKWTDNPSLLADEDQKKLAELRSIS